jgi:hypothetical protein
MIIFDGETPFKVGEDGGPLLPPGVTLKGVEDSY